MNICPQKSKTVWYAVWGILKLSGMAILNQIILRLSLLSFSSNEKKEFHQPLFIYIPILPKLSATSKRLSNCLGCKTSGSSNCLICKCQPNSFYLPLYGSEKFLNVPCEGFKQYHQVIFLSL